MSVFINARCLTQPQSGVQRYARELLSALDTLWATQGGPKATAFFPQDADLQTRPAWSHIQLRPLAGGTGHFWEQRALARASRGGALVSLCNSGPLAHPSQILALHDAHIFDHPQTFSAGYRFWHSALRPRLAQRAARLLTVSPHAAGRLSTHVGVPAARFDIVPNAAGHILRVRPKPGACLSFGVLPRSYFLCVGNASPLKNLHRLIAAHSVLPAEAPPLVVVGATPHGLRSAQTASSERLRFLGRVTDAELVGLYQDAIGFVFPSLDEGFGIPPLEAAALGAPVVAAKAGAMPWVLGDAPIWCDPQDAGDIARALSTLWHLPERQRIKRIAQGKLRAAAFSWTESAAQLNEIVTQVQPRAQGRAA